MSNHEIVIAQTVAQALSDAEFKAALQADPKKALAQKGVNLPADHQVVVLADTATQQHLIVPNQPIPEAQRLSVLPRDPSSFQLQRWAITTVQSGGPIADSLLRNPVDVLRGNGVQVPQSVQVTVHRNSDSTTYIALPHSGQAAEAEGELDEQQLDAVAGGVGIMVSAGKVLLYFK